MRLLNNLNVGKLFISNDQNYLVKEILEINDEEKSIIATLTNAQGDEVFFTGGYSQWFEGLVK
jgi:ribosomal protein S4E